MQLRVNFRCEPFTGTADIRHRPSLSQETWTTYPLSEPIFPAARNATVLSASQLQAIRGIGALDWLQP
jgi:hypothetical protein